MSAKKKSIAGKIDRWFPNCKEVTLLIVKEHEIKLSFAEKVKLYFHSYVVCKFCKAFRIQSGLLHRHIHEMAQGSLSEQPNYRLSEDKRSLMQKNLNNAMNGGA